MAERDAPPSTVLRLYISPGEPRSDQAALVGAALVERLGAASCRLEVVDVLENPGVTETDRVLATPMLVRLSPDPPLRLVGGLHDLESVLCALELGPDTSLRSPETGTSP